VPTRCSLALLIAVVFGAANGVGVFAGIPNAGWAWAALPVVTGALVRRPTPGALAGGAGTVVALAAFSVANAAVRGVPVAEPVRGDLLWWAASVTVCPVLGVLGSRVGRTDLTGLAALLVVPLGAALEMLVLPPPVGQGPVFVAALLGVVVAVRWFVLRRATALVRDGVPRCRS